MLSMKWVNKYYALEKIKSPAMMHKTSVCQGTLNISLFSSNGFEKKPLPVKQITGYEEAVSFR